MQPNEIGAKIIAALVLFLVTFGSTFLPYKFKAISDKCLKNISCFCGGLFIGLCFLHLLPDAIKDFSSVPRLLRIQKTFPMAELVICLGMMIVMSAEKVANIVQNTQTEKHVDDTANNYCEETCETCEKGGNSNSSLYGSFEKDSPNQSTEIIMKLKKSKDISETGGASDTDALLNRGDQGEIMEISLGEANLPLITSLSVMVTADVRNKVIKTICLLIALMVHSLFEGLTVGLQKSTYGMFELIAVLAFHKSIIGFSLGMTMVVSGRNLKLHLKQSILFASASPFGVLCGAFLLSTKFHFFNEGATAILICLATGTFIYITFFEILAKNLEDNNDFIPFSYFFIGFSIFSGITAVPGMK